MPVNPPSTRGTVDEPDVLLAQAAAAPTVRCAHEFVVVVAAATAHLGHAGKLHGVVEHGPNRGGVTVDIAFDVGDVVHAPRDDAEIRGEPVHHLVAGSDDRARRRVVDV